MAEPAKKPPAPAAPIPVATQGGTVGYLPAEHAQAAADAGGVRRATDAEMRAEQRKANATATDAALRDKFNKSFGSALESQFAPQAAGLARGLSLGTSDEAILRAAEMLGGAEGRESVRQRLLDYKEFAPVASTMSEIGGMTAGALAGDEAALGAAPGLVGRLGAATEAGAARLLGGGAVARGAGMLARGGVEGAAFGAGEAISESSLQNHDLTAEALVGGAAHGALGGMLAAGVIGGGGKVLSGMRGPKPSAAGFDGLAARTYGDAAPGVGKALMEEEAAALGGKRRLTLDQATLDAGLHGEPAAENPFRFGRERLPAGDVPTGEPGRVGVPHLDDYGAAEAGRPIRIGERLNPEAESAFSVNLGASERYGGRSEFRMPGGEPRAVDLAAGDLSGEAAGGLPRPIRITGPEPGVKVSPGTVVPREVELGAVEGAVDVGAGPIRLRGPERAPSTTSVASEGIPYRTAGARGPADSVAEGYIKAVPGSTADQQAKHAEAWANRERVFGKHAETTENATRAFSEATNEMLEAGRPVDIASFGESKVGHMSSMVDRSRFPQQAAVAKQWVTDADAVVTRFADDATTGMTGGAKKQWAAWRGKIDTAIQTGDSLTLHTTLDHMKRFVGKQAQFGRSPFGLSTAAREFDGLYQGENGIKGLLESDVWGAKAARAQIEVNAATHHMLAEGDLFKRKFTTQFGSDAGRPLYTADTSSVSGFMTRLTSAANDLDARGVQSFIDARRGFLKAVERNYALEGEAAQALARERAALDKMDGVFKQTTKDVTLANQVKAALAEERERGIGGAIGAVMDVANKPFTTLQRLAQLESHTKGVLDKLTGGTKELVGVGAKVANDEAPKMKPVASGQGFFTALLDGIGTGASKTSGALGATGGREAFAKRVDEIGTMQGNPALVADRVSKSLEPLGGAAPNVVKAATGIALRGVDFMASKLPPSRMDPYSLQPQLQPRTRASDAEISQFMRFSHAIDDPLVVLREAKSGTLTRDHVDAVKAVYPKLYDQMRVEVMRSLVQTESELPYAKRIQLGILLDLPTDKTLAPDFLREIQATYTDADKAGVESPPPKIAPPNLAGPTQTATQSAAERVAA